MVPGNDHPQCPSHWLTKQQQLHALTDSYAHTRYTYTQIATACYITHSGVTLNNG